MDWRLRFLILAQIGLSFAIQINLESNFTLDEDCADDMEEMFESDMDGNLPEDE